jgi:hypothetical protein
MREEEDEVGVEVGGVMRLITFGVLLSSFRVWGAPTYRAVL